MARIYLDARSITDRPAGVPRYVRSLIEALIDEAPPHEFVLLRHRSSPRPLFGDTDGICELPVGRAIDGVDNFVLGHRTIEAAIARGGPPDLFHCPFHVVPRRIRSVIGEVPLVTTIHDFVWLDHPDASQPTFAKARAIQAFARLAIPFALRASDRVIAVSEPTRHRARQFIDDDAMVTISQGVDDVFFEPAPPPSGEFAELIDPDRPYIVAVGNDKPYKNLAILVDAFERLLDTGIGARLVLVGDCRRLVAEMSPEATEWIVMPGLVDDDRLRRLLGHARVFCLPSRVEGFGLPLLEAMAAATACITSDVEPMRTIGGEATLRFPPDDAASLARLVTRLIDDDALADRLASRGRRRAGQFRWRDTARKTLQLYDTLL